MLNGTRKLLGDEYPDFVETMINAAEDDELPIALHINESVDITTNDLYDLMYEFHRDTGLDMVTTLFICNDCGRLHAVVEVNYSDDENTMIQ